MERKARGIEADGTLYDCLFESPPGVDETVKTGAELDDTIKMLPEKVWEHNYQARRIAATLRDIEGDVYKTCKNIWTFLYRYIAYKPDQKGKEQVRSVWRLWRDKLGDCDCFSFFTSSVLTVLGIPHKFRITAYEKGTGGFQHIYVVVPNKGKEITIDAVLPEFDNEYPYKTKIDKAMDLQFLNGIDPDYVVRNGGISYDAQEMMYGQLPAGDNAMDGLKDLFQKAKEKTKQTAQNAKEAIKKTGAVVSKGLHIVNKVNPATAALRMGILTGMKTNLFGLAGQIRYTYLSDSEALKMGINMKRLARAKNVRIKLEKIFFGAGGKPENLKEAVLTGKGNQDKAVALSGYGLYGIEYAGSNSVRDIIGGAMYADELPPETLNGLGEVVTATVVAAASGLLAAITGVLKNIGPLFQKGEPGPDTGLDALDKHAGAAAAPDEQEPYTTDNSSDTDSNQRSSTDTSSDQGATTDKAAEPGSGDPQEQTAFEKVKNWVVKNRTPVIIGAVTLAALAAGYLYYRNKKNNPKTKSEGRRAEVTDGVPGKTHTRVREAASSRSGKNEKILRKLRLSRMN